MTVTPDVIEPCFGRLYGRAGELDALAALLADPDERLITVTGVAGVGKSHLAHAASVRAERDHGLLRQVIDLSDATDEGTFWSCAGEAGRAEALERFGRAGFLLVLDNCDPVIRTVASAVSALLRACPHLTVVVTSRVSVELRAEVVVPVSPLETGPGSAAEELFVNLVRPHYRAALSTAPGRRAATEICAETGGIPLALALAADAVAAYGPIPVLERLRDGDCPGLLRMRDVPARHRTARQAIAWTDHLLSPAERDLLGRLSAYPSAFDLDGACAAADASEPQTLAGLDALLHKSLLTAAVGPHGEPEFRVPPMVRAYYRREPSRHPVGLRDAIATMEQCAAEIVGSAANTLLVSDLFLAVARWSAALQLPAGLITAPETRAVEAPRAYGLTPRQHQIALLVADGLTNRQIARQLEISEWTVVNHLRVVMQKMDCASRVQVVRAIQRP